MLYYQQGDIILKQIKAIPSNVKEIRLINGIIQEGEATGHAHKITGDYKYFEKDDKRYLRIINGGLIKHEEHKEFEVPEGDYTIGIVREYDHFEEEAREVLDWKWSNE